MRVVGIRFPPRGLPFVKRLTSDLRCIGSGFDYTADVYSWDFEVEDAEAQNDIATLLSHEAKHQGFSTDEVTVYVFELPPLED